MNCKNMSVLTSEKRDYIWPHKYKNKVPLYLNKQMFNLINKKYSQQCSTIWSKDHVNVTLISDIKLNINI